MNPIHTIRNSAARSSAILLLLATASTVGLNAQNEPGKQMPPKTDAATDQKAVPYASLEHMIGAPVYLQASAEAVAEASRDGEAANRPKAKVVEWLVDSRNGSLSQAVVSIGGFLGIGDKTVLVPAAELTWNSSMERYDLGWTKDQLKAKPEFDLSAACKSGLDAACGIDAEAQRVGNDDKRDVGKDGTRDVGTAEASMRRGMTIDGTTFTTMNGCLCKASDLAALPVYAGSAEWGKVKDLIVDRAKNRIALAVVNHGSTLGVGGKDYLVAYPNFVVAMAAKDKDDHILCAPKLTSTMLEGAVTYEKPKNGVVDPSAAKQALERDGQPVKN